jgi:cellular nucleic acid-binding protein
MTCYNCKSPYHFSNNCPKPKQASSICHTCKQPGHKMSDCPNSKQQSSINTCHTCKQPGHKMSDCPNSKQPSATNPNINSNIALKCYNCSGTGHKSDSCSNPKKCYNCGNLGHISTNCKEQKEQLDGDIDEKLCIICMDKNKEYIVVPCGHFKYCAECVKKINTCSTCRGKIDSYVKVF